MSCSARMRSALRASILLSPVSVCFLNSRLFSPDTVRTTQTLRAKRHTQFSADRTTTNQCDRPGEFQCTTWRRAPGWIQDTALIDSQMMGGLVIRHANWPSANSFGQTYRTQQTRKLQDKAKSWGNEAEQIWAGVHAPMLPETNV